MVDIFSNLGKDESDIATDEKIAAAYHDLKEKKYGEFLALMNQCQSRGDYRKDFERLLVKILSNISQEEYATKKDEILRNFSFCLTSNFTRNISSDFSLTYLFIAATYLFPGSFQCHSQAAFCLFKAVNQNPPSHVHEIASNLLKKIADEPIDCHDALNCLGKIYTQGLGKIKPDLKQGINYFEQAIKKGSLEAKKELAEVYMKTAENDVNHERHKCRAAQLYFELIINPKNFTDSRELFILDLKMIRTTTAHTSAGYRQAAYYLARLEQIEAKFDLAINEYRTIYSSEWHSLNLLCLYRLAECYQALNKDEQARDCYLAFIKQGSYVIDWVDHIKHDLNTTELNKLRLAAQNILSQYQPELFATDGLASLENIILNFLSTIMPINDFFALCQNLWLDACAKHHDTSAQLITNKLDSMLRKDKEKINYALLQQTAFFYLQHANQQDSAQNQAIEYFSLLLNHVDTTQTQSQDIINTLKLYADNHNSTALIVLACCYRDGTNHIKQDEKEARVHFEKLADIGVCEAINYLDKLKLSAEETQQRNEKMHERQERAYIEKMNEDELARFFARKQIINSVQALIPYLLFIQEKRLKEDLKIIANVIKQNSTLFADALFDKIKQSLPTHYFHTPHPLLTHIKNEDTNQIAEYSLKIEHEATKLIEQSLTYISTIIHGGYDYLWENGNFSLVINKIKDLLFTQQLSSTKPLSNPEPLSSLEQLVNIQDIVRLQTSNNHSFFKLTSKHTPPARLFCKAILQLDLKAFIRFQEKYKSFDDHTLTTTVSTKEEREKEKEKEQEECTTNSIHPLYPSLIRDNRVVCLVRFKMAFAF